MQCENNMQNNTINRLKAVFVEQNSTSKWFSEQLGKDPATISKWCSNSVQPSLEMLAQKVHNMRYLLLNGR